MPITSRTWPTTLPRPEMGAASYRLPPQHDFAEPTDFNPELIGTWRRKSIIYSIELTLKGTQGFIFESFYAVDLTQGMRWFNINLAMAGSLRLLEAHFVDGYLMNQISQGNLPLVAYRVTADLEIKLPEVSKHPWE